MTTEYLSISEVAERLNIPLNTAKTRAHYGVLPEPDVKIGTVRGWSVETIDGWSQSDRPINTKVADAALSELPHAVGAERDRLMAVAHENGYSLSQIGEVAGITRQAVSLAVKRAKG